MWRLPVLNMFFWTLLSLKKCKCHNHNPGGSWRFPVTAGGPQVILFPGILLMVVGGEKTLKILTPKPDTEEDELNAEVVGSRHPHLQTHWSQRHQACGKP